MSLHKSNKKGWCIEFDAGEEGGVDGWIESSCGKYNCSLSAAIHEGVATDGNGEREKKIPDSVIDYALDIEAKLLNKIDED